MNTPVREGETIGGVPYHAESTAYVYQVLKCSRSVVCEKLWLRLGAGGARRAARARAPADLEPRTPAPRLPPRPEPG